ncbi:MAG: methionine ABC transporter ATP-binding protein, partial [Deltaproteobacteria bacterium]|nr:methionine ABC transporter ATP-binding protein [Deltaproteobacteria bacterium]
WVQEPFAGELATRFGLSPIILQAHVDRIKDTPFGTLILDLAGPEGMADEALCWIRGRVSSVEVLN